MAESTSGHDLSRRQFLKNGLKIIGVTAISSPFFFLAGRRGAEASDGSEHDIGDTPRRPWCMIIDLKKCDGCVSIGLPPQCTQACIQGHYAPEGQKWIEVYHDELPGGGSYFLPTPCFQCENAPCVNVCPVAATYHDKNGIVLIDHRRCIGCRLCMAACPYQRRFFNWGEPELPPEAALSVYSPLYPVPAVKGTVIKCMFCAHLLPNGRLPFCVTACPNGALYMGELNEDIGSNGHEVVKLSRFMSENDAYQYKEELGTHPRVWYLPGHGQEVGRKADDPRGLIPNTWQWGGFKAPDWKNGAAE